MLWYRLLRQELKGEPADSERSTAAALPKAPRFRVPAPQVTAEVADAEDPEMAAYNRYLNSLHEKDLAKGGKRGDA